MYLLVSSMKMLDSIEVWYDWYIHRVDLDDYAEWSMFNALMECKRLCLHLNRVYYPFYILYYGSIKRANEIYESRQHIIITSYESTATTLENWIDGYTSTEDTGSLRSSSPSSRCLSFSESEGDEE